MIRHIAFPGPASERLKGMVRKLVLGLGEAKDNEPEDRSFACFVLLCSELASIKDATRRDRFVNVLTDSARVLVQDNINDKGVAILPPTSSTTH
jgi:hypothetical protein